MKKFMRAFSFSEPSCSRNFDITETIEEHSEHLGTTEGVVQNGHKNGGKYERVFITNMPCGCSP